MADLESRILALFDLRWKGEDEKLRSENLLAVQQMLEARLTWRALATFCIPEGWWLQKLQPVEVGNARIWLYLDPDSAGVTVEAATMADALCDAIEQARAAGA